MLLANTLQDIEKLPPEAQNQLVNFIEFLKFRYGKQTLNEEVMADDASFGAIHVSKRVSLAQMEEAIAQQGNIL